MSMPVTPRASQLRADVAFNLPCIPYHSRGSAPCSEEPSLDISDQYSSAIESPPASARSTRRNANVMFSTQDEYDSVDTSTVDNFFESQIPYPIFPIGTDTQYTSFGQLASLSQATPKEFKRPPFYQSISRRNYKGPLCTGTMMQSECSAQSENDQRQLPSQPACIPAKQKLLISIMKYPPQPDKNKPRVPHTQLHNNENYDEVQLDESSSSNEKEEDTQEEPHTIVNEQQEECEQGNAPVAKSLVCSIHGPESLKQEMPEEPATKKEQEKTEDIKAISVELSLRWLKTKCIAYSKTTKGSRHLQALLDKGGDETKEVLSLYMHEVFEKQKRNNKTIMELASHKFANYVIQRIIELSGPDTTAKIIEEIRPYIYELSMNQHGTRSIQSLAEKAIENNDYNEQTKFRSFAVFVNAIRGHIPSMICDNNGNHVINKILDKARTCPGQNVTMNKAAIPKWLFVELAHSCIKISKHKHGCCVYQNALKRVVNDENVRYAAILVQAVIDASGELIYDMYANYVVQYCLDDNLNSLDIPLKGSGSVSVKDVLCDTLLSKCSLMDMCNGKSSSNVIENCAKKCGPERLDAIVKTLLSSSEKDFTSLISGNYSNYVIQTIMDLSPPVHDKVASIIKNNQNLYSNMYCRSLLYLLKTGKRKNKQ